MSAQDDIPAFTGDDVVRLFTSTYLPLCRALHAAGALDPAALARRIRARADLDEETSWAALAQALANVLQDDAQRRS